MDQNKIIKSENKSKRLNILTKFHTKKKESPP